MNPVLTEAELAELLRLPPTAVDRLLLDTDVPRLVIAGKVRFVATDVIDWLRAQAGDPLPAARPPADMAQVRGPRVHLDPAPPASADEVPVVTPEELAALGVGADEPAQNLARQRLRDVLVAIGDELHPTLTRGSRARLHPYPEEAHRTSAWRVDPGTGDRIEQLVMPFGEGAPAAVGYADRPRIELVLTADHFTVRVAAPADVRLDTTSDAVRAARAVGAADAADEPGADWAFGISHPLTPRAPTQHGLAARVADELDVLLPIWLQVAAVPTEDRMQ